MSEQIETYLRAQFAADAERAPRAADLAGTARARAQRQRRRGAAALGAGLLTLTIAVGLAQAQDGSTRTAPPAHDGSTSPAPAEAPRLLADVAGGREPLDPGRYIARFDGADSTIPMAVIEVPAGYLTMSGTRLQNQQATVRGVDFYTVGRVNPDACSATRGRQDFEDPGPTVEDLATALANQPGLRPTAPTPVSIGGYQGLYVELSTPEAPAQCTQPGALWLSGMTAREARGRHTEVHDNLIRRGTVDRFWILNVDGQRLVIDAYQHPRRHRFRGFGTSPDGQFDHIHSPLGRTPVGFG